MYVIVKNEKQYHLKSFVIELNVISTDWTAKNTKPFSNIF